MADNPDLSKVRLVDPASYERRQDETQQKAPEPEPVPDAAEQFGLEFNCDEGERKFGADRYYGTVSNRSGAGLNCFWSIACLDQPTPDCIEGTNVSELSVRDDTDGRSLMKFENGQWMVEPKGNMATAIRDRLVSDYADRYEDRENFMGRKPNPEGPRVMDTMSDMAIGKAMKRGDWDEVKAALEAPVNAEPAHASAPDAASKTPEEERDARIAARVAEIEAEHGAKAHDNAMDSGRTI